VFATGRDRAELAALERETTGLALEAFVLDVTSPASIAEAVVMVDERTAGRGLDVLVNNAGYATVGALAELSDDAIRAQFDTNVFGLMAVTRAFLPAMFTNKSGRGAKRPM
jgi:NADP-dependent 3-hydroxy acid dehydrogenase YdfG